MDTRANVSITLARHRPAYCTVKETKQERLQKGEQKCPSCAFLLAAFRTALLFCMQVAMVVVMP